MVITTLVIGLGIATALSWQIPNAYRSESTIVVIPQRISENYVKSTVTTRAEDRLAALRDQTLTRERLEKIVSEFDLYPGERRSGTMDEALAHMVKDVSVTFKAQESFTVSFVSAVPQVAQQVTDRLAGLFIAENTRERESRAVDTDQFLESQLEDSKQRLIAHEKRLEAYRRRYSGELPAQADANLQIMQSAEAQRQALADSVNRTRERRSLVERQLADLDTPEVPVARVAQPGTSPDAVPSDVSTSEQLRIASNALSELKARKTPEHPDVRAGERRVRDLEQQLAAEKAAGPVIEPDAEVTSPAELSRRRRVRDLTAQLQEIDRELQEKAEQEDHLRGVMTEQQARLSALPTRESELVELTRDYTTLQESYQALLAKREESKISTNLEKLNIGEQFRMVEPARVPTRPLRPNRLLIYLGGAGGGLAVGILLIGLLEYREVGFRREDEITRVLSLPVLAAIPVIGAEARPKARTFARWTAHPDD